MKILSRFLNLLSKYENVFSEYHIFFLTKLFNQFKAQETVKVEGCWMGMCDMNTGWGGGGHEDYEDLIDPRLEEIKMVVFGEASS